MNGRKTAKDEERSRQENAKCNLASSTLKPQGGARGQTLHAHPGEQEKRAGKEEKGDRPQRRRRYCARKTRTLTLQGYLAQKKTPILLGPPHDPRHRPPVGS